MQWSHSGAALRILFLLFPYQPQGSLQRTLYRDHRGGTEIRDIPALLHSALGLRNNGLQEAGISLGISGWERGKVGAWCQPEDGLVTWEVTLHSSDNLSDSFAMETGAEIRMGQ